MNILIASIGKWKSRIELELFNQYVKRIPWKIELKEVEEKKPLTGLQLQTREAELLMNVVPKGAKKIVLDEKGKVFSSKQFADKMKQWRDNGDSSFAFLIGGADGHAESTRKSADLVLSLGAMTWPHLL